MMAQGRRYHLVTGWIIVVALIVVACSRVERPSQTPEPPPTMTVHAAGDYSPGDYVEEIVSGGQTRRYRLHIPPGYRPGNPMPLVVNLHGAGSSAAWQERISKMSDKADQAGFIAAHPEALGPTSQSWCVGPSTQGGTDITFIRSLIRRLESQLSIDAARIYVTGFSNGAEMTFRLGCELSDLVAAIAPVSGFYPSPDDCHPVRPVPVVAFHGTADKVLPYNGLDPISFPVREWAAAWAARNACDPTPVVTFQRGWVTGETWSKCQAGADVVLYTVEEGGHSWPGSDMTPQVGITTKDGTVPIFGWDISATGAMWEFFAAHPKP